MRLRLRTLVLEVLVVVLLLLGGHRFEAQAPGPVIGSDTAGVRQAGDHLPQQLSKARNVALTEVAPTQFERRRLAGAHVLVSGPYDQVRYGFSNVRVHFVRELPSRNDRSELSSNASLQLWVELSRRGQSSSWWRVPIDDNVVLRGEHGPLADDRPGNDRLQAATADAGLPVLEVQWTAGSLGGNSMAERRYHLLLDLRTTPPKVTATLADTGQEGGGACGFPVYPSSEIGCRWDRTDFLCSETVHLAPGEWADRRGSRQFRLSTGDAGPPVSRTTLDDFLRVPLPDVGRVSTIDRIGEVRVIDRRALGSDQLVLFGAPALEHGFGARLFLSVQRDGRTLYAGGVTVKRLVESPKPLIPLEDPATLRQFTPDSLELPRFRVEPVATEGSLTILKVIVDEGSGRGLFLVGIDRQGDTLTADAVQVAVDASHMNRCFQQSYPRTAVTMTVTAAPFAVELDIEPGNAGEDPPFSREDGEPACPIARVVTWASGSGFTINDTGTSCRTPAAARFVTIAADGGLTHQARPHGQLP